MKESYHKKLIVALGIAFGFSIGVLVGEWIFMFGLQNFAVRVLEQLNIKFPDDFGYELQKVLWTYFSR